MKAKRLLAAAMAFAIVFGAFGTVSDTAVERLGGVSVSAADEDLFEYDYGEDVNGDEALFITKYTGSSTDVTIPATLTIDGEEVEVYGVSEEVFGEGNKIQTLKINTDVHVISCGAFRGCTSLKSVEFVKGKNDIDLNIEPMAFDGCTSLVSVVFPELDDPFSSNLSLQCYAFVDCTALKSVTVPAYVWFGTYEPVFGYERKNKADDPEFEYLGNGSYETNLQQIKGFVMRCYMHTSAHMNTHVCGLQADFIDGVASAEELTKAVKKASDDNPNYDVKMTAQSYTADRVNNFGDYIDVIDEYYYDEEAGIMGLPAAGVHSFKDPKTGKTVIEHATAFPFSLYDPIYSNGVFSVSCFGGSHRVQECDDLEKLLDKDTHLIKAPENGVTLKDSTPLYYGTDGKLLFEHEYVTGDAMVNGYAYVATKNGDGSAAIIDKTGKTVLKLPESFSRTGRGGHGGDQLSSTSSYSYYSTIEGSYAQGMMPFYSRYEHSGKTIFDAPCEQEGFNWSDDGFDAGSKTCGYIDLKGNIVIPQSFSEAGEFTEDKLAWVGRDQMSDDGTSERLYGYINTKGEVVIPMEYDDVYSFDGGYAIVMKNGKYGMIDTKNKQAVSFVYDVIKGQKDGFMTAMLDGKWGIVDRYDNVVVPFMFEDVSLCIDGTAYGVSDGRVYKLDVSGASDMKLGDVNNDGDIDIEDAVRIIAYINAVTPLDDDEMIRADVDLSSEVDIKDAVMIINHINGVSEL